MQKKAITIFAILAILALAFPSFITSSSAANDPKVDFLLTLLHNNDGESQLIDLGSDLEDYGGAARFKSLVDELKYAATHGSPPPEARTSNRAVLMVSSGDNFLAGPEFNSSLGKGVPFYDTIAMDLIGYDAVAIGNHDFDFGPDVLADFIAGYRLTQPPYLSANLDFSGEPVLQALFDEGRIAKSAILRKRSERVGIIGATTPNLPFISSPRNVVVDPDVAGVVQTEVDKLEGLGVNKIILISHLQNINEDIELAAMLDGVDIMVAGGGDEVLANPGDLLVPGDEAIVFGPYPIMATDIDGTEVPVVTTRGNYSYVGQLVVGFDEDGNVIVIGDDSGPKRVAGGDQPDAVEPNRRVQKSVVDPLIAALDALATNVIGTSEVYLDGIRDDVRSMETNEGNLVADSFLWQAEELAGSFGVPVPDVALQNGGGIRNDSIISAGPITELDTFDMLPFANFLSVVENIPREQFKEILENAVACTQDQDFTDNPNCGSGRFAQIGGFSYEWTASGIGQILDLDGNVTQVGTRVLNATLDDGTVLIENGAVVAGPDLTVATIDFLANGGDQYPFRGAPFTTLGVSYQQALANYIETGLSGLISAAEYPEGGEGRITSLP